LKDVRNEINLIYSGVGGSGVGGSGVGGGGAGGASASQKFCFGENPGKILKIWAKKTHNFV